MAGQSQLADGPEGRVESLVVQAGASVVLASHWHVSSTQSGSDRAVTVQAGGTLELLPGAVLTLGGSSAGAHMAVQGTLKTDTLASEAAPRIRAYAAPHGFAIHSTGTLDVTGLGLEDIGGTGHAYGLDLSSGNVTAFDRVHLRDAGSTTAVIRADGAVLPAGMDGMRIEGLAPANVDATAYTGANVLITGDLTEIGDLFGETFEIDPQDRIDWLEPFRVIGGDPAPGEHDVAVDADISLRFSDDVALPPSGALVARGGAAGVIGDAPALDGADTLKLTPQRRFHPNETIEVTATTDVTSSQSEALSRPHVRRFRAAATGGTGVFGHSAQLHADLSNAAIAKPVDLTGNGVMDLAIMRGSGSAMRLRLFVNNGYGSFEMLQDIEHSGMRDFLFVDLNRNGLPDVVVAEHQLITLYMNTGNGTMEATTTTISVPVDAWELHAADLNGNGWQDLVMCTVNTTAASGYVYFSDGQGGFDQTPLVLSGSGGRMAIGDVTGNGALDLVTGANLHRNDGAGGFSAAPWSTQSYLSDGTIELADFNGNGRLDLVAVYDGYARVYFNDGAGEFSFGHNVGPLTNSTRRRVTVGDFNGSGDLDFLLWGSGTILYMRNAGNGTFTEVDTGIATSSLSTVVADFDGDGDLDIVYREAGASGWTRIVFNDTPAERPPQLTSVAPAPYSTILRDTEFELSSMPTSRRSRPTPSASWARTAATSPAPSAPPRPASCALYPPTFLSPASTSP
jgi:hypothetical protein